MTVPSQNTENQAQSSNDKELNFRAMESRYQRELQQANQARMQAEERAAQLERSRKSVQEEQEDDSDDQPYVDKRSLHKTLSKFSENIDQKIEKKAEEKARTLLEQERQINFVRQNADFNQVLTAENIQKFADKYPETAGSILENIPEGFGRQKHLYNTMKDLGIGKKEEPKVNIQEIIDKNRQTPFYQPSSYSTPAYGGQKGDFSPEGQKAAYEKMKGLIKGRRT